VRVPGSPGVWVAVSVAQLVLYLHLPGKIAWPITPILALVAMIAAVTRAYQDAALASAAKEAGSAPK
jgi:uncharacterized membrane protein YhhN